MKKMILAINESNEIARGFPYIDESGALLFDPMPSGSSFSFYPYHWTFQIKTRTIDRYTYQFLCALAETEYMKYEEASLSIPTSKRGQVRITLEDYSGDGIYYSDYERFTKKIYIDKKKGIIAVGKPTNIGTICIEFAENEYILLDNMNRIESIIIRIPATKGRFT